jgi:hypothetical protein
MGDLENWKMLMQFLPEGWEEKAKDLGAVTRQRKIPSAEILLRVLLIHLADGCSLRETVVRARNAKLADISDVALLKRLRSSNEWLRWLSTNMLEMLGGTVQKPCWLSAFNVRIVDASIITEPGSTGSDWRLHFSMELFGVKCDYLKITEPSEGESFTNYFIKKGDLMLGDRAYGSKVGITHVLKNEGDFLVRIKNKAMALMRSEDKEFNLLENFRELEIGEVGDWDVLYSPSKNRWQSIRLCAIKKSAEAAEHSRKKAKQDICRKQRTLNEDTLELHGYFFVITSVKREVLTAEKIMALYRLRWQIELAFKRLKSILGLGHLPKTDPDSAKAWLHGKMVVALLASLIVDKGRCFSPWGYPLAKI